VNSDIRLAVTFKGHRKRKKLRLLIGDNATDYLIDLWLSAAQDRPDGHLSGWTDIDIALAAGWEGDATKFVTALLDCELLEQNGTGYKLHDWEEHQPWACNAAVRSENARRSAVIGWERRKAHAERMPDACGEHAESNAQRMPKEKIDAPSPSPSPSPRNVIHPQKDVFSPIQETESDDKRLIFDHWNAQKIVEHRKLTDPIKRRINGALANYKVEEIVQAIDNYAFILASPLHFFKYKWTLADFLMRGLDKFMDRRVCDANYKKDTGGNGRIQVDRRRPTEPTPEDATPDYGRRLVGAA